MTDLLTCSPNHYNKPNFPSRNRGLGISLINLLTNESRGLLGFLKILLRILLSFCTTLNIDKIIFTKISSTHHLQNFVEIEEFLYVTKYPLLWFLILVSLKRNLYKLWPIDGKTEMPHLTIPISLTLHVTGTVTVGQQPLGTVVLLVLYPVGGEVSDPQ